MPVADRLLVKEDNVLGYLSVVLTVTACFQCFSGLNKAEKNNTNYKDYYLAK